MNLFIDRGTSRQGIRDSIERVLEFRVLDEGARVIRDIGIITPGAKANAKSDGDGYNGNYSETRRDKLGTVRNGVEWRQITIHLNYSTFNNPDNQTAKAPPKYMTCRLTRIRFRFRF